MTQAITLYGIPNCDTVKKARTWLTAQGVVVTFHDFKKQGVPEQQLDQWLATLGWDKLLNRQGQTWRKLDATAQAAVVDAPSASITNGLVKAKLWLPDTKTGYYRGTRFDWATNDIFVVPNFLWRRHINTGHKDAVLYAVSDAPLLEKIGQYRAQGRLADGTVTQIVA